MRSLLVRRSIRLASATVGAAAFLVLACADVKQPAAPSETSYPTITITANGISKDGPALIPGMPVRVINADTVAHRLHLDVGDQPGCASLDTGDIPPGESRLTQPVGLDVTACAAHDHVHHGDARFQIRLSVDSGD